MQIDTHAAPVKRSRAGSACGHGGLRALTGAAFAGLLLLLAAAPASAGALVPGRDAVAHQVLVRFEPATGGGERLTLRSRLHVRLERRLEPPGIQLLDLPEGTSITSAISKLERSPRVAYAEPNYLYDFDPRYPNDGYWSYQWGLSNLGLPPVYGKVDADIDAPEAWETTVGSPAVTVAVADTGVVFGQPDLQSNLRSGGYDFFDGDPDPTDPLAPGPVRGHGTEVAGVIGAVGDNYIGTAGVNWKVGLLPLRVASSSAASADAIIAAIGYADSHGARVFNGSFGNYFYSQAMKDAIDAAPNTLFSFAAANESNDNDSTPAYPCSYPSANIVCVAATDPDDRLAPFSNYGKRTVDLGAPGVEIRTTPPSTSSTTPEIVSGTSFAAPMVSGAAALVLAALPEATTAQVKARILGGTDPVPGLTGKVATGGRLNADQALPGPPPPPPDSTPPVTKLKKTPKKKTTSRSATFRFSSNEADSTFTCRLDSAKVWKTCRSPKRLTHLRRGRHSFSVRATDPAGNTDPTPVTYRWKIKKKR